jgi:HK97 gp10 family phage protein
MGLKGGDEHIRRLRRLASADVIKTAGEVVYEGADMIQAEAHHSIVAGSVGGKAHVPSKPGEPPNSDTGVLAAMIGTYHTAPVTAEVRSEAPYSAALEWGTSKMAARPFMRPARDKMAPKIRARFAEQMNKLIARSGT